MGRLSWVKLEEHRGQIFASCNTLNNLTFKKNEQTFPLSSFKHRIIISFTDTKVTVKGMTFSITHSLVLHIMHISKWMPNGIFLTGSNPKGVRWERPYIRKIWNKSENKSLPQVENFNQITKKYVYYFKDNSELHVFEGNKQKYS